MLTSHHLGIRTESSVSKTQAAAASVGARTRFPGIHPAIHLQQLLPIQEYKLRRDPLALILIGLNEGFALSTRFTSFLLFALFASVTVPSQML
ncbi:hypothetical protein H70357_08115 [Paenibacillus sp. FSL H7-0357]|nr:hypothetical protein H70357_08115 [Paenibacillus sp. FSL H7-0357]